jgi:hypothetical protein
MEIYLEVVVINAFAIFGGAMCKSTCQILIKDFVGAVLLMVDLLDEHCRDEISKLHSC